MSDLATHSSPEPEKSQKLIHHLVELRRRLLNCVYIIVTVFAIFFYFSNSIFELIARPLLLQFSNTVPMITTAITGTFVAPLKLTFFLSLFVAMPFIFYQIWRFLAPGLYKKERIVIWPLLLFSTLLFYLGMVFAYFVVFPLLFKFFIAIAPHSVAVTPDIGSFIDLVLKLFFAFGLCFEVPVVTIVLITAGVISLESVKEKRPYVFVGSFILGMLLTPPDVISQILLALPLYLLFELGIIVSKIMVNKKRPARAN